MSNLIRDDDGISRAPADYARRCVARGKLDELRKTVERFGVDILSVPNAGGDNAIHIAASHGQLAALDYMVTTGAPLDVPGFAGHMALYCAAYLEKIDVVRRLIDAGADVNGVGTSGTALIAALQEGNSDIATLLLAHGAKIDASLSDIDGKSAMDWILLRDNATVFAEVYRRGMLPTMQANSMLDWLIDHPGPASSQIPRIVDFCLGEPALAGNITAARMRQLAASAGHPAVGERLLAEATDAEIADAIPDAGAEDMAGAAMRRPRGLSL